MIHLEATIERVWRFTWKVGLSELQDALGDCDQGSLEMHLEYEIDQDGRLTLRSFSSEWGDSLGGHGHVGLEE